MARILHFADLHLDSSFASAGMASSEARRRREELRAALRRIIDLALERDVDAVTVGGDLYEHDRVTLDTGRFIASQFERLAPRPVLIAPGNHDRYTPDSLYRRMEWPPNVHIFSGMEWESFQLGDGVTIWGVGHNGPAVRENLLRKLHLNSSRPAIALLHGSDVSSIPEKKEAHCPFERHDVEECGATFLLLGHYHGMRLWPPDSPRYGYPGSPEPLGFDEQGPHYVLLVTVEGQHASAEPVQINDVNYRTERVDVTGMTTSDQIRHAIIGLAGSEVPSRDIVRVALVGEAEGDLDVDVASLLAAAADHFRYLEIDDQTEPAFDIDELRQEGTTRGAFVRLIEQRMERAEEQERELLKNALVHGLRAFANRQVRAR